MNTIAEMIKHHVENHDHYDNIKEFILEHFDLQEMVQDYWEDHADDIMDAHSDTIEECIRDIIEDAFSNIDFHEIITESIVPW